MAWIGAPERAVAASFPGSSREQLVSFPGFPELTIWVSGPHPPRIATAPFGRGVLVGDFYARADGSPYAREPRRQDFALKPREAARNCLARGFGRYLVLWPDMDAGGVSVLRDPSGAMEAVVRATPGGVWVSSSLSEVPTPALAGVSLDWRRVGDWLLDPVELAGDTALKGLSTPAPGVLLKIGGQGEGETLLWSPADAARDPPHDDLDSLAVSMRTAVDRSVRSAAGAATSWLMELSGGFDSAVVAASLREAGVASQLANLWTEEPEGDERRFARLMAAKLGRDLVERLKSPRSISPSALLDASHTTRPAVNAVDADYEEALIQLASEAGVDGVMTGQGGDSVFWTRRTALVARRRWLRQGLRLINDPWMRAIAGWSRRSLWAALADVSRKPRSAEPPLADWIHPDVRASGVSRRHPWREAAAGLDPERRLQVEELTASLRMMAQAPRNQRFVTRHPLLAQPVVELTLRIPVEMLVCDGRERGLARRAFGDRLAPEVAHRWGKGDLTRHYGGALAMVLGEVRELLLEGRLTGAGLLDRRALEAALDADRLMVCGDYGAVMDLLAIEAWVRTWGAAG